MRFSLPLLFVCCLSACSILPERSPNTSATAVAELANDFERSRLIALDLVNALVQISTLSPAHTTLYTARPNSRFGALLVAGLQDAGYELRVGSSESTRWLSHTIVKDALPHTQSSVTVAGDYTFIVSVGMVKVKRTYRVDARRVRPGSSLFVHGADARGVALNDALFDDLPSSVAMIDTTSSPQFNAVDTVGPATSRAVRRLPQATAAAVPLPEKMPMTPLAAKQATLLADPGSLTKHNMYDTRQSNFSDVLAHYDQVRREVLVFPNDSMIMDSANKRLAREISLKFNPKTDVISVIGCSHGRTKLHNGNQMLALGRANRVKEELMLAGVAAHKVLDEGCWASTHFDQMPARGVVVTHKRRAG